MSSPCPQRSRRRFLELASRAGVALPFANILAPSEAIAAGESPKRILIVYMPNVVWRSVWLPAGGRDVTLGTGDASMFEYGAQSAFLDPIRQHTTLIHGLPILRPVGDPHVASQLHFMSGDARTTPQEGAEVSGSPSADQIFANDSSILSQGLVAPVLNLSAHTIGEGLRPNIHLLSFDHNLRGRIKIT
ncbi:MAG: hypothetical protein V3V08_09500 [Nannocystaceae bacterium]